MTRGMQAFIAKINSVPKLSREQETELGRRWREDRDMAAGDAIVLANLRYAAQIAMVNTRMGTNVEDILSASCMGFVYALTKYDERKGVRFVTYAAEWARAFIFAQVSKDKSLVTGGKLLRGPYFFAVRRERAKLLALHGDEERVNEMLAGRFNMNVDDLAARMRSLDAGDMRLDRKIDEESGACLVDMLTYQAQPSVEETVDNDRRSRIITSHVRKAINDESLFDKRERQIILRRLLKDGPDADSLQEIGNDHGITRERVRQLENRIKRKLRTRLAGLEAMVG